MAQLEPEEWGGRQLTLTNLPTLFINKVKGKQNAVRVNGDSLYKVFLVPITYSTNFYNFLNLKFYIIGIAVQPFLLFLLPHFIAELLYFIFILLIILYINM